MTMLKPNILRIIFIGHYKNLSHDAVFKTKRKVTDYYQIPFTCSIPTDQFSNENDLTYLSKAKL